MMGAQTKERNSVERELIPITSRLPRPPTKVPLLTHSSSTSPTTAIPAPQSSTIHSPHCQDVHYPLNAIESPGFTQPLTQHDLKHPIRRPRTSNHIFQSATDLAAHYGIPQRLPPAPSTSSTRTHHPKPHSSLADFATLSQNYLDMLSDKPTDTSVSPSTAELAAPVVSPTETDTFDQLAALLVASPEFRDLSDLMMTSPMPGLEHEFGASPEETPFHEFLGTPLFEDDDILTSPLLPLFPQFPPDADKDEPAPATNNKPSAMFDIDVLHQISPFSPPLESFDNFSIGQAAAFVAPPPPPAPAAASPSRSSRGSKATGIRRGITVDALLDESAPTQPRKYATPSATSRKEVPATFARKRSRSAAFGDEEDELGDERPPNDTERGMIEQKRLKNTLAARKSRRRKLELFQNLEKARDEERQFRQIWKERALVLLETLREHGVDYPDFPEEELEYEHI